MMLFVVVATFPVVLGHPQDKILVDADSPEEAVGIARKFHAQTSKQPFWCLAQSVKARRIRPVTLEDIQQTKGGT